MTKPEFAKQWLTFDWNSFSGNEQVSSLKKGILNPLNNIEEIKVTFNIPYSILIRYYSELFKDVDSSHISSNGKFVIPGTSWNGAIRHAAHQILLDLGVKETKIEALEKDLFGYAAEKDENSHASNLSIKESVINNGKGLLTYTRNKVDRFTGGVVDAALFDEMPYYNGNVSLNMNLKLKDKEIELWKIGLIKLAIQDIGKGIQPVGGDANIGRGILELSADFKIEDEYLQALARKLEE
jgi:CRISPR/Cas system CSM-associated protein Csm3 (group 7 of RAMP superfamily)